MFIVLGFQKDLTKIINQPINILTVKTEEDDESQRTTEAFTVFERSIRTGIHHEFFGEFGLSQLFVLAGLGQAIGHVVT